MSDPTHTPGPWRVIDPIHGVGVQMNSAGGFLIEGPHAEANARLIAAAPDLLAALKFAIAVDVEMWCERGEDPHRSPDHQESYDRAVAAIAKAEGRS